MQEPICYHGAYGPYILHGQENRRDRAWAWTRGEAYADGRLLCRAAEGIVCYDLRKR